MKDTNRNTQNAGLNVYLFYDWASITDFFSTYKHIINFMKTYSEATEKEL